MAIENAIRRGVYFISIHSKGCELKQRSYANEELVVAIEEIRNRPQSATWFIPVKTDDCIIEPRSIGGGETLADLQICDLTNWRRGAKSLLSALGVEKPTIDLGKPLSLGIPSFVEVNHGFIRYDFIENAAETHQGMEHRISGGWCRRNADVGICAYFEVTAPLKAFQDFNRFIGYTGFHAFCDEESISQDPANPTSFYFKREFIAPRGTPVPSLTAAGMVSLPYNLPFISSFMAYGYLVGDLPPGRSLAVM